MIRTARDVGALIRERRTQAGLDQQGLADRAGVSRLWINEIERGKPGASLGRVLNTLAALGVELEVKRVSEQEASDIRGSAELIDRILNQGQENE